MVDAFSSATPTYRDPSGPALAATALLGVAFVVTAALAIAIGAALVGDRTYGLVVTRRGIEVSSSIRVYEAASSILVLAVPVAWLVWQYRVHTNAHAIARLETPTAVGWGVLCWFVPFVCFVKPYAVMREIARASRANGRSTGVVLSLWWGVWLIAFIAGLVAVGSTGIDIVHALNRAPDALRTAVRLSRTTLGWFLVSEASLSLAAVLAVVIVRAITAGQRDGADRPTSAPARPDVG